MTQRISISDIKKLGVGTRIQTILLVKESSDWETKTGSPYVAMTLGDMTGTIEARAWQVSGAPPAGSVIQIGAKTSNYRETTQLTVDAWTILENDDEALMGLVPAAPKSGEELLDSILYALKKHCHNDYLLELVDDVFESTVHRLETWPAAKGHHHARVSGLVQHIYSMICIAENLEAHYKKSYSYPIDLGLVIVAIIFHDLGKVYELTGPVGTEYSDEGRLVGHIAIGLELLYRANNEVGLEGDLYHHLRHLILSHHGKKEWGSPVEPMTPEAVLLHQIDLMDSRMDKVLTLASEATESGWVDAGYGQKYMIMGGEK